MRLLFDGPASGPDGPASGRDVSEAGAAHANGSKRSHRPASASAGSPDGPASDLRGPASGPASASGAGSTHGPASGPGFHHGPASGQSGASPVSNTPAWDPYGPASSPDGPASGLEEPASDLDGPALGSGGRMSTSGMSTAEVDVGGGGEEVSAKTLYQLVGLAKLPGCVEWLRCETPLALQGYLAHKKQPPPMTLQQD